MLHIERKPGEAVVVGRDIRIVVTGTRNGSVRLGFIAPHDVRIYREEVFERIEQEKSLALAVEES